MGDCLLNGIVGTIDLGDGRLIGIVRTTNFGDCLLVGIVRTIDFGDCFQLEIPDNRFRRRSINWKCPDYYFWRLSIISRLFTVRCGYDFASNKTAPHCTVGF